MTPIGLRGQARKSLPDPRVSVRVIAPCQALRSPLRVNSNLTHHTSNRVCIKPGWLQTVMPMIVRLDHIGRDDNTRDGCLWAAARLLVPVNCDNKHSNRGQEK